MFTAIMPSVRRGVQRHVGTPRCVGVLGGYLPADAAVVEGRSYTNINMSCAIQCGASNQPGRQRLHLRPVIS